LLWRWSGRVLIDRRPKSRPVPRLAKHRQTFCPTDSPRNRGHFADHSRRQALADPAVKARFAELGVTALPGSPADFGKLIAEETEKWAKVIRFAGIKPE
jgi:tripartite-type tricarboxylate transporter receptor subunit TctC